MENPAGFYPLDDLYNPGSTTPSLDTHLGFEPVSPGADFGDLPPSRGEYFPEFQRASSAKPETSQLHASLEREFIDIDALSAQESEVVAESTVAPDTQHVEETQETPAQGTLEAVIHEVDDVDGEPINSKEDIDVVSVPGNVLEVCSTEYVVEEVVTKGRRTEVRRSPTPSFTQITNRIHRNSKWTMSIPWNPTRTTSNKPKRT